MAGFYENSTNGSFAQAYCAAVSNTGGAIANETVLWASEPEHVGYGVTRSGAPTQWSPDLPPCANHTVAWQYREPGVAPPPNEQNLPQIYNVDLDEYLAAYSNLLW